MDGRRTRPLSDEALDRELAAALQVEPSPEYVARIRARVAREPAPSAWFDWRWASGVAVASAVVVLAFVALWRGGDVAPPSREARTLDVALPIVSGPGGEDRSGGSSDPRTDTRSGGPPAPRARDGAAVTVTADIDRPPFAEVLISPDEVRAYELLLLAVEERRLPPVPEVESTQDDEATLGIEIAPLVIAPLQTARLD
jgi:hypothetical protein